MDAFLQLFAGMSRLGPGSDASTRRALRTLGDLPAEPRILDIGCGRGPSSIVLARETGGWVTAVDLHQPFLEDLEEAARAAGLSDRIQTICAPMDDLELEAEPYDVAWSEGAAYLIGFEYALNRWAPFVKKGGAVALTEASWLTPQRPVEAMRFWADAYPDMQDVRSNLKALRRQGFEPIDHFVLPPEDWTTEYYGPLERNLAEMRARAEGDEELSGALDATEREIEIYRKYGDSFGYVFYTARKVGS